MSENKKIIIALHGLKGPNDDDLEPFVTYAKDKLKYEVIRFPYYDNSDKKTLNIQYMDKTIKDKVDEYLKKGYEIIMLGYSLGAVATIKISSEYKNVKNLVLVNPAFKLAFWWAWVGDVLRKYKIRRDIIKKLGKDRYKKMLQAQKEGKETLISNTNNYLGTLIYQSDKYRRKAKPYLKKLTDKNIYLYTSSHDHIINKKKNVSYMLKYFKNGNNNILGQEVLDSVHTMLKPGEIIVYNKVIDALNSF